MYSFFHTYHRQSTRCILFINCYNNRICSYVYCLCQEYILPHLCIYMYSYLCNQPAILLIFTITAAPVEVIVHYYFALSDNLDHSVICQVMLKLKLLKEQDLVYCGKLYSDYQRNVFLLDQLLVSDSASIVEFCHLLKYIECQKELGHMLVNGKS